MARRVTSLEVARRAGVSRSAVSRVFSGASASPQTIARVRRAAAELGYRPNVLARSLMTGQSRMIGLVVAYLDNHFYPTALEKLSNALQARGYHVLVFMAGQGGEDIDRVLGEILDYQVDGLVLASVTLSSELAERCGASGVPVVLFNRRQDGAAGASVTSDNRAGGRMAAEFLLAGNHRRFGHIAGREGASTSRDREAGFVETLQAAGFELSARETGEFRPEAAREATRRMYAQPDPPDALFVANDYMAFMAMDVLRGEFGVEIGRDVSVIGFDDVPVAAWPAYDLTTIRQDPDAMVAETVRMLLAQVEGDGKDATGEVLLPVELIVRGSARRPG